jgi:hypothetical protein
MNGENDLNTCYSVHDTTTLFCLTPLYNMMCECSDQRSGVARAVWMLYYILSNSLHMHMTDGWMHTFIHEATKRTVA